MENHELAAVLSRIATLLELKGESVYKTRAYRRAAEALLALETPAVTLWKEGRLTEIPGVGAAIAKKLDELLRTGRLAFLEQLEAEVPPTLLEMLTVPGLGIKKVRRLWQTLGITDVDILEEAARYGRLRALPGFGERTEAAILQALQSRREQPRGVLLGDALPVARRLKAVLSDVEGIQRVEIVGSVRRGKALVGDIDLLLAAASPQTALQAALETLEAPQSTALTPAEGYWEASWTLPQGIEVHLLATAPGRFGTALLWATGSTAHTEALARFAAEQGYTWPPPDLAEETAAYAALGLPWIPPELREGRGEVEAAAHGRLPALLTRADIRADLHTHSTWSDGRATIREMAEAAIARGLRVLAITDHSQSLGVAHGLTPERLRARREEIRKVQAELGNRLLLLQGAEVEILADGRLDYPDEVLRELDVVIAALHTSLRQPRERITERLLRAIRHPLVHFIAHPSGRLLPHRPGADLDWDVILDAAAAHGVALEINAHPRRLDLSDALAQKALDRGILLTVNTDAHRPTDFDNLPYGITTARRGWASAENVLNTWENDRLLAWLRAKHER